jgi:L-fuconolactonase
MRFVDAHVHHWDPANTAWYPQLAPEFDWSAFGMGGHGEGLKRRYLVDEYLADVRAWGPEKYVHVQATPAPKAYLEEGQWVVGLGGPVAGVIGTVDLDGSRDEMLADLAAQAKLPEFRGIRHVPPPDPDSPLLRTAFEFLRERDLVYDYVVHPDTMVAAASVLRSLPELTVVIEHTGWPLAMDEDHRELWRKGMRELAAAGPNVHCKLSGLAMTTHTLALEVNRPWLDEVLDIFGVERCLAGTNSPVDCVFGSVDLVMQTLLETVSARGDGAVDAVFASNAERVYRI